MATILNIVRLGDYCLRESYLSDILSLPTYPKKIRKIREKLRPHLEKFDCVVCTGVSGAVAGSIVAMVAKKPIAYIRKSVEGSHSTVMFESPDTDVETALIVDDFVDTGATVKKIKTFLKRNKIRCYGTFMVDEFSGKYTLSVTSKQK